MKKLLTEQDVLDAWKKRQSQIYISPNSIITPAALDAARAKKVEIKKEFPKPASTSKLDTIAHKKIEGVIVGSDHGGFELKSVIIPYLHELGYVTEDVGTYSTESVDYPDFAFAVAQKVSQNQGWVGVIIDGAGVGSAMTANKVPGIRAAACYDAYTAKNSREHNFANVLTLGSRVTGIDIAKNIVKVWLETEYGAERHKKRVEKIKNIEDKFMK